MLSTPFDNAQVSSKFDLLPSALRQPLLALRQTILDVAAQLPATGGLVETLRWDEPAYHPVKACVGTTIRINAHRRSESRYALYVPCQTSLVGMFGQHYPSNFTFEGNRALIFEVGGQIQLEPLRHCLAMALTYHLSKTRKT